MKKKKGWNQLMGLVALLVIFSMLMVACGAEEATDTPAPEPTEPPAMVEETPTAEEAPAEEMEEIGGTVSVLAVWGGEELDNFMAMIEPFEEQTGITVEYEGTRDLNAVLTTRIEGGNPPDLAGLPGPGQLLELARAGELVALNDVLDMDAMREQYDEGFLQLATVDDNL